MTTSLFRNNVWPFQPSWTLITIYSYINWIGKPLPKWEADWQPSKSTKDQWALPMGSMFGLLAFILWKVTVFGICK